MLDALGRYGVFGIVGTQWDGDDSSDVAQTADNAAVRVRHANDDGGPPLAGLTAYVNNIKNHPALLGYYLFDVRQASQCHYLPACLPACLPA